MELSDTIIVMNEGKKLVEGQPEAIRNDDAVIEAYLGV
jgi:branched-chain amino acid transport system ATP-binding protein